MASSTRDEQSSAHCRQGIQPERTGLHLGSNQAYQARTQPVCEGLLLQAVQIRCKSVRTATRALPLLGAACRISVVPGLGQQGLLPHVERATAAAHSSNARKHEGSSSQERQDLSACELRLKHLRLVGKLLVTALALSRE